MGKPTAKKKDQVGENPGFANTKQGKHSDRNSKAFDEDMTIFINMSQEIREEGNKLFQKRDHEGAMLKYEKALKLLPKNHTDIANLRSNMAACYMQLGLSEYPRAVNECNLALEVSPRYSKALIKRARCYEGLNRFDLAFRDVNTVLSVEPNNLAASEMFERVKKSLAEKGVKVDEKEIYLASVEPPPVARLHRVVKEKLKKKNSKKNEEKTEDKVVVEEKVNLVKDTEVTKLNLVNLVKDTEVTKLNLVNLVKDKEVTKLTVEPEKLVMKPVMKEKVIAKTVKLVFGEDIRWAQLPEDCSMKLVRDIVCDRFPGLKGVLVKYKDQEGDLVTITTVEELRLAEASSDKHGSLKLYIAEVGPDQEPVYEGSAEEQLKKDSKKPSNFVENGDVGNRGDAVKQFTSVESWIVQFAQLFKNHVGIESDSYLDLHEVGMKLYSEAMDDTITNDDAQELFEIAADQFQEMAALALFNWGNVHMSRARKQVFSSEDISRESLFLHIKNEYEWAEKEYKKAETRYEEALKIKPDFYEGFLALGQQQFEHAKLCWYYAIATNTDLAAGASSKVVNHYNRAEDSIEKGIQIWEESEEQRLNGLSKADKYKSQLEKIDFSGILKDVSADEASEQAASIKSQIYLLWGTLLYERSIVEYKLSLPTWEECLEVAVEKFELAGASPTDIAVMIKNHCSNDTALDGLGFKIDEIVQAWNEMYDAKRLQCGDPSFRLEPLFRRRVPTLLCFSPVNLFVRLVLSIVFLDLV